MLLLVLILVLIAFALLVVALLSGSVLSAWLSVAVSVAAAAVLVVDWLQRRAATRAGTDELAAAPSRALSDVDPVTEVLPVVPSATAAAPAAPAPDDGQQTVVMPVVAPAGQPPGSAPRPPGAENPTTPSGGSSSRPVTNEPVDRSGISSAPDADRPVSAVERTVAVDVTKKPPAAADAPAGGAEKTSVLPPPDAAGDAGQASASTPAGQHDAPAGPDEGNRGVSEFDTVERDAPGRPAAATTPGAGEQAAPTGQASSAPVSDAGEHAAPAGQASSSTAAVAGAGALAGAAAAASTGQRDDAPDGPGEPSDRGPHDAAPHNAAPLDAAPHDVAGAGADADTVPPAADAPRSAETAATAIPGDAPQGGLFDPVVAGSPPPDTPAGSAAAAEQPSGSEPPEEPLDTAAARIVAGLVDEVVVVDEQPRYHVEGCRALVARAVIPLPAREAVELGFTPCGWCTPDATLAARHRADARP